ncbi:MAG: ABC transporter substrate-binding protein [Thermosynechococcaceae cyanobacterium]
MPAKKSGPPPIAYILGGLAFFGLCFGVLTHFSSKSPFSSQDPGLLDFNSEREAQLSTGTKILFSAVTSPAKLSGVEALAAGNRTEAIAQFQQSLRQNRNDPETLIYLNNAQAGDKPYGIGVSVPIASDANGAAEILRGVAQAQREINQVGGVEGHRLQVTIADDGNDAAMAKQVAQKFVGDPKVLGVVGHYASDVTLAAGPIYNDGKLSVISPISTSVKLSNFSPYVFRTVPSDYVAARALANYMLSRLKYQKAAVFFNAQSAYSQSLKGEFSTALALEGGQVVAESDLASPDFNGAQSVASATQQGAEVLALLGNTGTLDKALQVVQANQQRLTLLGGDDVYSPKTLQVGGEAAVGMVVAVPWHIQGNPNAIFPKKARQLWGGDVSWRTAIAYDATQALIAAMRQSPSREGVQKALRSADFSATGASGRVRFLPSGDRNAPIQLVKIVPGQRSGTGVDFVPLR